MHTDGQTTVRVNRFPLRVDEEQTDQIPARVSVATKVSRLFVKRTLYVKMNNNDSA